MKFQALTKAILENHIEFHNYNLYSKYNEYNSKLFGGILPKIPITWGPLKRASGITVCKTQLSNDPQDRMLRLFNKKEKYKNAKAIPGSISIKISNLLKRSELSLDKILIHEMIHVYFFHIGDFTVNHGAKFQKMCKDLSTKIGFEIPLTDIIDGTVESVVEKPITVVLAKKHSGDYSFSIISAKSAIENQHRIERYCSLLIDIYNYAKEISIIDIKSSLWSVLSNTVPTQRISNDKDIRLKFYKLKDDLISPKTTDDFINELNTIGSEKKVITKSETVKSMYESLGSEELDDIVNNIVLPKHATHHYKLVRVDVNKLDDIFKKEKDFYVGYRGVGGINGRYDGFLKFLQEGLDFPVESSLIHISEYYDGTPKVSFENGRHRFAVFRDLGLETIPMGVSKSSLKLAQKIGLVV